MTAYPMGEHIQDNKPQINKLIQGFKSITEFNGKKINFICMSSSGAIVAALFALQVDRSKITHIKKENERSHNGNFYYLSDFEGYVNVIVDDFVGSGATFNNIYQRIKEHCPHIDCVCVTRYKQRNIEFTPDYVVTK